MFPKNIFIKHLLHMYYIIGSNIVMIIVSLEHHMHQSSYITVWLSLQIGFLLSVPRLPSMVQKEDFEMEGLDFMVCV